MRGEQLLFSLLREMIRSSARPVSVSAILFSFISLKSYDSRDRQDPRTITVASEHFPPRGSYGLLQHELTPPRPGLFLCWTVLHLPFEVFRGSFRSPEFPRVGSSLEAGLLSLPFMKEVPLFLNDQASNSLAAWLSRCLRSLPCFLKQTSRLVCTNKI